MNASRHETADDTPMLADIARQGMILSTLLERLPEIEAFTETALRPAGGGTTYAFGSGDGWFAARAAGAFGPIVGASGLDFLLRLAPRLTGADRALAISMSGNVDRTVEAAAAARDRGAGLAVLTNGDGGRLGRLGAPLLPLAIPDLAPFLCGTASYTATLAVLALAGGILAGRTEETRAAVAASASAASAFVANADAWASEIAAVASPSPGARILSSGLGLATAEYGAAKLVEVTTIPAWSDDVEEFAHRQFWSMGRGELVVFLIDHPALALLASANAAALGTLGCRTAAIASDTLEGLDGFGFVLPYPGDYGGAAFFQAIALQLLAYRMGKANGTDPDRRPHLKADVERFAVSRQLTRRSLLGTGL